MGQNPSLAVQMSPQRPPAYCPSGCGTPLPPGTPCPTCRATRPKRPTASARGYNRAWLYFKPAYVGMLITLGITPVCGAALPAGPDTQDSKCKAARLLTWASRDGSALHLDHVPPLTDAERRDESKVCDPLRIQLLCASCHNAKDDARYRGSR